MTMKPLEAALVVGQPEPANGLCPECWLPSLVMFKCYIILIDGVKSGMPIVTCNHCGRI